MIENEVVTWSQVEQFIDDLKKHYCNVKFSGVYGIPKGGVVIASMIAYNLNIPLLMAPHPNCLVVDDITDTGNSLKHYQLKGYKIATMYWKQSSEVTPDFYIWEKKDNWIIFPWERS